MARSAGRLAGALLAFIVSACASIPEGDVSNMTFVQADGVQTHVRTWGDGPSLFLVHGASSDMAVFEPTVIPLLADRFHLTAYDRPGMGYTSERPSNADELGVQARIAAGVIEASGLQSPIVVAHSYGGAVALRLALDRPDLISGLVLIAPVAYEWPGGVSWHLYWSSNPLAGPVFNNLLVPPFAAGAVESGLQGAFHPQSPPENYLEEAASMRAVRPHALRANAQDMVAAKREIISQQVRYPGITMPVAILAGDADRVVSTTIHSRQLARTLTNVRLDVLPGVGHLPHEMAPERLIDLVEWVRTRVVP
jgi:pimeloyl-ACP methyl ester carboxylesterase